jgi:hypothetical protein
LLVNANTAWSYCDQWNIFVLALTLEKLLLKLGLGDLDLDGLVDLLRVTAAVVGVVLDGGGEEGVDEGEGGTALRNDLVTLVGQLYAVSI